MTVVNKDPVKDLNHQMEENGMWGGKRYAREHAAEYAQRRKNMTPEELKALEENDEKDKRKGTWMLIGLGVIIVLLVIANMSRILA